MLTHDFPPRLIGGEGVFAGAIAERLHQRGIGIEVVAPGAPGDADHDASLGFIVHRVPVAGANFATRTVSFAWSSRRLVRNYGGDLVYALRPVFRPRQPMLGHFHVTRAGQARAAWRAGQWLAAFANGLFIPVDRNHARHACRVIGVNAAMRLELGCATRPPDDFVVVPNGIDTERFTDDGREPLQGRRLLFVGRLDALKRVTDLLRAVAILAPRQPGLSLTLVGSGRELQSLVTLARTLGIQDLLRVVPQVAHADMPEIYRAHDLLVLPSAYESFGLVALEAMACGTPAVTSDACAALGQRTCPVGDVATLVRVLEELLDSPEALSRAGRTARLLALRHDWEHVASALIEQFEEALRGPIRAAV